MRVKVMVCIMWTALETKKLSPRKGNYLVIESDSKTMAEARELENDAVL